MRSLSSKTPKWKTITATCLLLICALYPVLNATQPIFYDEAYTLQYYASQPFRTIVTLYDLPNNHIGFTLLENMWLRLIRGIFTYTRENVWTLRVPVVLFSLIAYFAFFCGALRLISQDIITSALATIIFASFPVSVEHSFQLRGYSPSIAYVTIMLAAIVWLPLLNCALAMLLLASCAFFSLYTIPTNIWFLVPFYGAVSIFLLFGKVSKLSASHKRLSQKALVAIAAGSTAAILAYIPVLRQMPQAIARITPAVSGDNWQRLTARLSRHLSNYNAASSFMLPSYTAIPFLLLSLLSVGHAARRGSLRARRALVLSGPPILLSLLFGICSTSHGFARSYALGTPFFAIAYTGAVVCAARLSGGVRPLIRQRVSMCVLSCIALITGWQHALEMRRDHRPDAVVKFLKKRNSPETQYAFASGTLDFMAIHFYTRVFGMPTPKYAYDVLPTNLAETSKELYLVSGDEKTRNDMYRHFRLNDLQPAIGLEEVAVIGGAHIDRAFRR